MERIYNPQQALDELLVKVNDLSPAIGLKPDLKAEWQSLCEIRDNLYLIRTFIAGQSEQNRRQQAVLEELCLTSRQNLHSILARLDENITSGWETDADLRLIRLTAEAFVAAHNEYLRYREAANGTN